MNRLTPWTPFRRSVEPVLPATWRETMDRFLSPWFAETNGENAWFLRMDAKETPEAFVFTAEVPGLEADAIDVSVNGDRLAVRGEKRREERKEMDHWHMVERSYGAFERTFTFPVPVESEHVDADLKDGILNVKVMKSKKALPKKVMIQAR